jgi:hypothetical protein
MLYLVIDPVVSRYGISFERKAILAWLEEGNTFCPVTGNPLRPSCLVTDNATAWKIRCWFHQQGKEAPVRPEQPELSATTIIAIAPERYLCEFTKELMKDPVMSETGHNFEHDAILKYLDENGDKCPVSGLPLYPHQIVRNHALRHEIDDWKKLNADHGVDLPALKTDAELDVLSPRSRKRAIIGIRGDPAVIKMRELHEEHLKMIGLPVCDDENPKDPFSNITVIDDQHHTMQSLGHIF